VELRTRKRRCTNKNWEAPRSCRLGASIYSPPFSDPLFFEHSASCCSKDRI